ncbi:MAG: hypothetical protein A2Z64_01685 [Betaproteobacteria bacterium RIFCSPLOWO2_02_67_12]|nr:MAG: hypothetical protein A2Z64_01685 [Betaproteobacteria bacterium RIFCSPLOWO2_02_67_12]
MKRFVIAVVAALLGAALMVPEAEAARMGGGRSIGAQRSIQSAPPAAAPAPDGFWQRWAMAAGSQ